jgi:hypothetical protein
MFIEKVIQVLYVGGVATGWFEEWPPLEGPQPQEGAPLPDVVVPPDMGED